ncbi:hypothetical protein O9K51_01912 [Purpureocillium lavendulum]|uniref:Uncharacterized protein n=1 Tax=Purpureocillium lavendulum TaxID=1247861 RepID=A0AB34G8Q0_9HYPO|nr:hypothetical protein O9K51_01912 [Purpureocillium lavendulum]
MASTLRPSDVSGELAVSDTSTLERLENCAGYRDLRDKNDPSLRIRDFFPVTLDATVYDWFDVSCRYTELNRQFPGTLMMFNTPTTIYIGMLGAEAVYTASLIQILEAKGFRIKTERIHRVGAAGGQHKRDLFDKRYVFQRGYPRDLVGTKLISKSFKTTEDDKLAVFVGLNYADLAKTDKLVQASKTLLSQGKCSDLIFLKLPPQVLNNLKTRPDGSEYSSRADGASGGPSCSFVDS